MGEKYLIDTNVIIDYTAALLPAEASDFAQQIFSNSFNISVINKIELLGFNGASDKMKLLETFLEASTIFNLSDEVVSKTIELKKLHKKLKLGDAIIAATSMAHSFIIVTRNVSDFSFIKNIQVVNPYSLPI